MKAKTYKSTNNFTAPQSLSTFGIEISNGKIKKHLGLEEFNFCQILEDYRYKNKKVAFIPCFSTTNRAWIDKLELFYLNAPGATFHYATLYGVSQIQVSDIGVIRGELIRAGLPDYVQNSQEFQANFGVLFSAGLIAWNNCFNSNNIIATGTNDRFILNAFYERIQIHNPQNQVNWINLKKARPIYR